MKLFRAMVLGMFLGSLLVGCGPKNVDTDPKGDELNLKIDEGDGDKAGK